MERINRAILFLNLGGPEKQSDVRDFLYRLFEDPEVIRIRPTILRRFVAWMISTFREKKSQMMYQKIGGGSPIRKLTDEQSKLTRESLKSAGKETIVETAFSCSDPLIEDVIKELTNNGVTKFLLLPLYPQYSITTTKGALERSKSAIEKYNPKATIFEITSFPTHPLFIKAHTELILDRLNAFSSDGQDVHLIFSAHSIPVQCVEKLGDPYKDEMEQTVKAVLSQLNWKGNWTLSWQSKLGPVKWLEPSTESTIIKLGDSGVRRVLLIPIAFVTDHIETLYEIDQELSEVATEHGITEFKRTPGLNNQKSFIECLRDLALSKTEFWN